MPERSTVRELLRQGREVLAAAGVDAPRLDSEVLLMALLGLDRARLYAGFATLVDPGAAAAFAALIARRAAGEPVAYLAGHREFMGLDFQVDPRVLIPRPETEWLVTWGLERLKAVAGPVRVVDVGTGSGAVAVSLAHYAAERGQPHVQVIASDRSRDALDVAAGNVARLAPGRVALVQGDLLDWCRGPLDLLLANLPYLRADQAHPGIGREPAEALFAADAGFALYAKLLPQAATLLAAGGGACCEIDPAQREQAITLSRRTFPTASVRVEPDLAGLDRYLVIELPR